MTTWLILSAVLSVLFIVLLYALSRKGKLSFKPSPGGPSTHAWVTMNESTRREEIARARRVQMLGRAQRTKADDEEVNSAILNMEQTQMLMGGLEDGTLKMADVQQLMRDANESHVVIPVNEPVHSQHHHHEHVVNEPVPSPPRHIEHSTHFPHVDHVDHGSSTDSYSSSDSGSSYDGGSSDGGGSSGSFD